MTIEEMRTKAHSCGKALLVLSDPGPAMSRGELAQCEDVKRTLWRCAAEICERLDTLIERLEKP